MTNEKAAAVVATTTTDPRRRKSCDSTRVTQFCEGLPEPPPLKVLASNLRTDQAKATLDKLYSTLCHSRTCAYKSCSS